MRPTGTGTGAGRLARGLVLGTSLLAAWPQAAVAAPAGANEGDRTYDAAIKAAVDAFERRDFALAYREFETAHGLRPSARTLRGLGLAAFEMGNFSAAATHLHDALATTVTPLPAKLRAEAAATLKRAEDKVATLDLVLAPPDATVAIDQAPAEARGHVYLAPGAHTLALAASSRQPKTMTLVLAAGEKRTVSVELPPVVAVSAVAPPPHAPILVRPTRPEKVRLRLRAEGELVFWIQDLEAAKGYRVLCQAPCEVDLATGAHLMALSEKADGKPVPAGAVSTQSNALVRGELRRIGPGRAFSIMGWSMVGIGALTVGGGFLASDKSTRYTLDLTGVIIAFVGGIFVLSSSMGGDAGIATIQTQAE